jgi:hypothetical protein
VFGIEGDFTGVEPVDGVVVDDGIELAAAARAAAAGNWLGSNLII